MANRLKLYIPKSKGEWVWDFIGFTFYIGSILFLLAVWNELQNRVPVQYNAFGKIDRWQARKELLVLPDIGLFILILMQVLEKFPEAHNYPERFNSFNADAFYRHSRKLVNQLKNICLVLFSFILFESSFIALGWWNRVGPWLLPLILLGTGIPVIGGMIQQRNIR
jgi:hypothetical protein